MKQLFLFFTLLITVISCETKKNIEDKTTNRTLSGTWELVSSKVITKGDTTITSASKDQKMIKMFNDTHFAFFKHDLHKGSDASNAVFDAGSGTYTLKGDQYFEHLEYCNYRGWENHDFTFTLTIKGDSLIQR